MYLIDTNIFLEILLEQEKSKECEALLKKIRNSSFLFYVSSFTLHSIEVIMIRNNKVNELMGFLSDVIVSKIIRIDTNSDDEINSVKAMKELKLDFDDSIQFYVCKKYNLKIISFDKHFDRTQVKRLAPGEVKL